MIAGYNMSPGYIWDGEYLCWSLKELADIDMKAKAAKHPPGLQSPHVTKRIRLPKGNHCYFPLKEKYDRLFQSIEGVSEILAEKRQDSDVVSHIICPDEHVEKDEPDVSVPVSGAGSSGDAKVTPPREGVLNRAIITLVLDTSSTPRDTYVDATPSIVSTRLTSLGKGLLVERLPVLHTSTAKLGGTCSLLKIGLSGTRT